MEAKEHVEIIMNLRNKIKELEYELHAEMEEFESEYLEEYEKLEPMY